ncbi:MAG: exodeoxyribonuclease III [Pleomorphochaeta sp.]|jgi:exodeoxyribonuclease-3
MKELKFTSWNVNGIRACDKKGFKEYFKESNSDIFCLQEIKLSEGQYEFNPEGYYQYFNYAQRKGYSGTAIYTKEKPLNVVYGISHELDNEGRTILLEFPNYYVLTVYTPNSQNELRRLPTRLDWDDKFREYVSNLDKEKPVIMCGDFNVAHKEIDLKNPKTNVKNAGFSPEERESFTKLLNAGFTDSFRYLYPDVIERYSWWSYRFKAREKNAGWRIDYWLVSNRLETNIVNSEIDDKILGSDHAPVYLNIKL